MRVTIQGAYITAAGTICAALIVALVSLWTHEKGSLPMSPSPTVPPTEDDIIDSNLLLSNQQHDPAIADLVALLKSRAAKVIKQLNLEQHELLNLQIAAFAGKRHSNAPSASPSRSTKQRHPKPTATSKAQSPLTDAEVVTASLKIVDSLQILKREVLYLHVKYINALSSNQPVLAHQLRAPIQFLLRTKHKAIYEEAGAVCTTFDGTGYYPPPPVTIGSWDVETVDLDLQEKYPGELPPD